MLNAPLHAHQEALPPVYRAPSSDQIETLQAVFPALDRDLLGQFLAYHAGNVEAVVIELLDCGATSDLNADDHQLKDDEEMARALHTELQRELMAEEEQRATPPPTPAANQMPTTLRKMSSTARARSLLRRVRSRVGTSTSTRSPPLLDSPLLVDQSSAESEYDMTPIMGAEYSPPLITPETVEPSIEAPSPTSDERRASASADNSNVYRSRMERARSANRTRLRSQSSEATTAPLLMASEC